ncbi:MAG: hypothetical protein JNN22_00710 [Rhodospirillales bacterium]|nr:hypothetical protein [Rhodospirillales bacterium]
MPFTTPIIVGARVRGRGEDLELVVPNPSGAKGNYILQWKSLPDVFTLTVHDRVLHRAIGEAAASTPDQVRRATLKTAATGLAGPAAAKQAKAMMKDEEDAKLLIQFTLLADTVAQLSQGSLQITLAHVQSETGRQQAKLILARVAHKVKLEGNELYALLEQWADLVGAVGVPKIPKPARLRRMRTRIEEFANSIGSWSEVDKSDASPLGALASLVARETVSLANEHFAAIDAYIEKVEVTVAGWEKVQADIETNVRRISWMLDGWDLLVAMWEDAVLKPAFEQQATVQELARIVPIVPEEEVTGVRRDKLRDIGVQRRKLVKPMEDWVSGTIDSDLRTRLERYKAKAA